MGRSEDISAKERVVVEVNFMQTVSAHFAHMLFAPIHTLIVVVALLAIGPTWGAFALVALAANRRFGHG